MSAADDVCPAMVTCQWLNEQLTSSSSDVIVMDVTFHITGPGLEAFSNNVKYSSAHIPGSRYLDVESVSQASRYIPSDLPTVDQLQEKLRSLGVRQTSHIVLYETFTFWPFTVPRLWWLIRAFGHQKVSMLNGGLQKWEAEGFTVTAEIPAVQTGDITLSLNSDLMVKYDELAEIRAKGDYQLVDTRPPENFSGKEQEPSQALQMTLMALGVKDWSNLDIKTGAMPGAKSVPYPFLYDSDMVSMRPISQLRELFSWAGVDLTKPLLTTCYVGYTACMVALAAHLCGNTKVPVYYGSWVEYSQRAAAGEVTPGTLPPTPPPFVPNLPGSLL